MPGRAIENMNRITDTFKRLNAVMKDINGDSTQIVRTMQNQIDYLLEKVDILLEIATEQNDGKQPEFSETQKKRLAQRGKKLNEFLLGQIERGFSPGTIHSWFRELIAAKYDSSHTPDQKKRGRKPLSQEIVQKVLYFQERNPDWGYERIASLMRNFGYSISASTVKKILDDHGIVPDPERRIKGDWERFINTQRDLIAATDGMAVELQTPGGLSRRYVYFFEDIATREVRCGGIAQDPDSDFTTQIARNMCDMWDGFLLGKKYLIHDNDPVFNKRFDRVFESIGIEVKRTLPYHPDMNAYMEAFIKSARTECFDKLIITNDAQLRYVVRSYLEFYNHYRPHRALGGRFIFPLSQEPDGEISEFSFLGGLLHGYKRVKTAA